LLIVPEGVVIADLPEHPRVGPGGGDDGNSADDGQNGYAVQYVRRHDKLLQLTWRRRDKERVGLTLHSCKGPQAFFPSFKRGPRHMPAGETACAPK